jgi:hypothetical protein
VPTFQINRDGPAINPERIIGSSEQTGRLVAVASRFGSFPGHVPNCVVVFDKSMMDPT